MSKEAIALLFGLIIGIIVFTLIFITNAEPEPPTVNCKDIMRDDELCDLEPRHTPMQKGINSSGYN
jgi:hypothetical protein